LSFLNSIFVIHAYSGINTLNGEDMKIHGALVLLLVAGGSLIYAAMQQPRFTAHSRTQLERLPAGPARLAGVGHVARASPRLAGETTGRVDHVWARAGYEAPAGQEAMPFVCRLPAEVGPVPMLEAVDAWLRAAPDGRGDPALLRNLHRAAQRGNWLAKMQLHLARNGRRAPDDASAFRAITLGEWMAEHRIGALYAAVGEAIGVSGPRRAGREHALSSLDLYAAMHHNYPSQYRVGRELLRSGDAQQAAVGRRMLDCAARALPVYRRTLDGDALAGR
jgi:hypothetical protein